MGLKYPVENIVVTGLGGPRGGSWAKAQERLPSALAGGEVQRSHLCESS